MNESEVLSHFYVSWILLFEYGRLYQFVLYIIRGLGSPAEVLNPGLEPPLVDQVEYLGVDLVLFEFMVCFELDLSPRVDLHAYDLMDYLSLQKALFKL